MSSERYFSYYYGRECEQFTFFRIPKLLISDPYFSNLSAEAKLLYGLMLDRMCLSQRNGWFDDQGRVFIIFPLREIQRDLHVGKNTASRLAIALADCGLIRRVHRGQGMPDLIYVMNFASGERPGEPEYETDLSEELAWAAGYDSPEEAREDLRGGITSDMAGSKMQTDDMADCVCEEACEDNVSGSTGNEELIKTDIGSAANLAMQGNSAKETLGRKILSLVPEQSHREKDRGDIQYQKDSSRQSTGRKRNSTEYCMGDPGDFRSLKSKPLDRGLKSKLLESPLISDDQRFKNQTSGIPVFGTDNKTNINNIYNNQSSFLSPQNNVSYVEKSDVDTKKEIPFDNFDYSVGLNYSELIEAVKKKIEYDALAFDFGESEVAIFPHLIAEMIYISRNKTEIRIGQSVYNAEILRQRYLALSYEDVRHVLFTLRENHISPGNIRNYYIRMLYNAAISTETYYARRVDHDMHCQMSAV